MQLYELAHRGDEAAIRQGRWTPEELNARDSEGLTALMCAAIRGDYRTALALKAAGADVHLTDAQGRKAVHLAAKHGHSVLIACLIEGGCGG